MDISYEIKIQVHVHIEAISQVKIISWNQNEKLSDIKEKLEDIMAQVKDTRWNQSTRAFDQN
jgi:hypothetical protein